jgi:DNA-binding LacI/PurR family transcriptional regulator
MNKCELGEKTMLAQKKPKYLIIAEQLKNDIRCGKISEGECLPTQNQLISNHNVALGTARRVIDQLVFEGWARTEHRRGVFAQKPAESVSLQSGKSSGVDSFGFAVIGDMSQYDPVEQVVLKGFSSVLQSVGKNVAYSVFPLGNRGEEQFDQFLNGISGIVLNEYFNNDILNLLKKRKMKAVLVGYSSSYDPLIEEFHCVAPNIFMVGHSAGELLGMHRHKKIAIIHPSESVYFSRIKDGVLQACKEYEITSCDTFVAPPYEPEIKVAEQLVKQPEVTGLIIAGDLNACRIIQHMERLGVSVPEDKSVLAIGGISREILSHPHLSRIDVNLQMMGQEAARQLLDDTEIIVHKKIPAFYDQGKTLSFARNS